MPLSDSKPLNSTGVQLDETELYGRMSQLKLLNQRTADHEQFLMIAQEAAHLGSFRINLVNRTWKGTPELYKLLGIDHGFTHTINALTDLLHPDSKKTFSKANGPKKQFNHEFKIVRFNDGNERWLHGIGKYEYNDQHEPVGIIGVFQDITERKKVEDTLVRLNKSLVDRVNSISLELLNTRIVVEEGVRNSLARELHDGLGPILSCIKMFFQCISASDSSDKIKVLAEKGNEFINLALKTSHDLITSLNAVNLNEIGYTDALLNFTLGVSCIHDLKIDFVYNSRERFAGFTETTLYRITIELINNTIKHATASLVGINFKYHKSKKKISLSYCDNGVGFDFDKNPNPGRGFGLMNIRDRVKTLQGEMHIDTGPGKGFKVYIELPVL